MVNDETPPTISWDWMDDDDFLKRLDARCKLFSVFGDTQTLKRTVVKKRQEGDKHLDWGAGLGNIVVSAAALGLESYGIEYCKQTFERGIEVLPQFRAKAGHPQRTMKLVQGSYFPNEYIAMRDDEGNYLGCLEACRLLDSQD